MEGLLKIKELSVNRRPLPVGGRVKGENTADLPFMVRTTPVLTSAACGASK
jgi:hypothetical protein